MPAPLFRDWSDTLVSWARSPSDTEDTKAANAERMIRDAIRESHLFEGRSIDVYATGSYSNNTNARLESDVDVAVVYKDVFFYNDLPSGVTPASAGFSPATYAFAEFRNDVETALRAKFERGVTCGSKAFDVHENSYRLDADVTPFFQHRRYTGQTNANGTPHYYEGVEMRPNGISIVNWHKQHYEQGVAKNAATGRAFKSLVRILKRLRTEMADSTTITERAAATPIASFFLESLAYNAPHSCFGTTTYYDDLKSVIASLWNRIHSGDHSEMKEVSEFKWLFRSGQAWTPAQAEAFLLAAWNYVGFKNS